jgi:hypothetical protein
MKRTTRLSTKIGAAMLAFALSTSPALADDPVGERTEVQEQASFAADRADILAMAGNFKVTFDMKETTPWREGYEPIDAKISGGHETVLVIEDTGSKIVLQHLLVVGSDKNPFVVKHWRQDWEYEPEAILTYAATGNWELQAVPEAMRKGRWAQTVYQVDDSPRYAGWGQWQTTNGVRRWRSNWTVRPLARRDATRSPDYDHYQSINRHQPFPGGWIHWQDNTKMKWTEEGPVPYVQESVLNTYRAFDDYPAQAAVDYWTATKDYWAAVRAEWNKVIASGSGVSVEEEASTGTVISGTLLQMGSQIQNGEITEAAAIAEARKLIRTAAAAPITAMAAEEAKDAGY